MLNIIRVSARAFCVEFYQVRKIMSREGKDENLINIEEFIARAKRFGVDFGKGDPKNRLRYYVKIGLLPHAQRKSFNGLPPNGAYSEKTLGILVEIDKELKAGKSIQEIKREKEEKVFEERPLKITTPYTYIYGLGPGIKSSQLKTEVSQAEKEKELEAGESFQVFEKSFFAKIPFSFKIIFLFLISASVIFFANAKTGFISSISYFLADVSGIKRLVQLPPDISPDEETLFLPAFEPYLTINAETAINAPLSVKEKITAPSFALVKNEFAGIITVAGLTAEREYNFPDLSGTVCLTTGNCVGLAGEIITPGGTPNRLAKFISEQEVGDSSISDLYPGGVAIAIDANGNVGIGTLAPRAKLEIAGNLIVTNRIGIGIENPAYSLHVDGRIQATGDICTDLAGGRCLSTLPLGGRGAPRAGIGGSGTANYLPIWTGSDSLGDSVLYQTAGNIGIGITSPAQKLDVAGIIKMTGFQMPTNAQANYVLTSDADGIGTWLPLPEGVLPSGTLGQTLRHNGATWLADSFLYNTGSAIGIGTTSTLATLTIAGSGLFQGPLTIEDTSPLGQLVLKYNNDNHLRFILTQNQAEISASSTLMINSLSGEVRLAGGVYLFDASSTTIKGATFISAVDDATVRKSGEMVFRSATPIFRFSVPSQTSSTTYTSVSKTFLPTDSLDLITPEQLPGTSRVYAFLINFADDIDAVSNSTWRVYRPSAGTEPFTFEFSGQNLASLEIGNPYLTATTTLPDNDWRLEVKNPSADKNIRIFNILLLAYDEVH